MAYLDLSRVTSWHAHVYLDAASRDAARELRAAVSAQFGHRMQIGRLHERAVGKPRARTGLWGAPAQKVLTRALRSTAAQRSRPAGKNLAAE